MIAHDDPRHGSPAGWLQGCREACCRNGKKRDRIKREKMAAAGHDFMIPRDRIVRKLQALAALGWSSQDIADRTGRARNSVLLFMQRDNPLCRASTAAEYDEVYRILEMKVPEPSPWVTRTKKRAAREGWKPPLAWEDIDAGILADQKGSRDTRRFDLGEIDYVMQYHDFEVWLSPLEKSEIVRRWVANGRSERSLCQLTGWREGRYREDPPAEEAA